MARGAGADPQRARYRLRHVRCNGSALDHNAMLQQLSAPSVEKLPTSERLYLLLLPEQVTERILGDVFAASGQNVATRALLCSVCRRAFPLRLRLLTSNICSAGYVFSGGTCAAACLQGRRYWLLCVSPSALCFMDAVLASKTCSIGSVIAVPLALPANGQQEVATLQ